jgi:hypothetical protein
MLCFARAENFFLLQKYNPVEYFLLKFFEVEMNDLKVSVYIEARVLSPPLYPSGREYY